MSGTETPASAGDQPAGSRGTLWGLLLLLLLLLSSCTAYVVGRGSGDSITVDGARPAPTVTVVVPRPSAAGDDASPTPAPTVTVRVPTSNGGGTGSGSGDGSGGGAAVTGGVGGTGSGSVNGGQAVPFRLVATAIGGPLIPGEQRQLRVVISNPSPTTLTVRTIDVTVKTPNPSTCLASWFAVGSYDASSDPALTVSPNGSTVLLLPLTLINLPTTNQNACQGATIPLSLTGTGRLG